MSLNNLLLFPYSSKTILVDQKMKMKVLHFTDFFLEEIIAAIELFFLKKEFQKFDAHVGDTLCQIRAYKILLMAWECYYEKGTNFQASQELIKFKNIKWWKIKQIGGA